MKLKYLTFTTLIGLSTTIGFASDTLSPEGSSSNKRSREVFQEDQQKNKRFKYDKEALNHTHIGSKIWVTALQQDPSVISAFLNKLEAAIKKELDNTWESTSSNKKSEDLKSKIYPYPSNIVENYLKNKELPINTRLKILQSYLKNISIIYEEYPEIQLPCNIEEGDSLFGNPELIKEFEPNIRSLFDSTTPSLKALLTSQAFYTAYDPKFSIDFKQFQTDILNDFLKLDVSKTGEDLAEFIFASRIPRDIQIILMEKLASNINLVEASARDRLYNIFNQRYEKIGFPRQLESQAKKLLEFLNPQ